MSLYYNPFQKVESFIAEFYEDFEKENSQDKYLIIPKIIKNLVKGRQAKYSLDKPLVTFLQLTISQSIDRNQLYKILNFYKRSIIPSIIIEKLFNAREINYIIIGALDKLSKKPSLDE